MLSKYVYKLRYYLFALLIFIFATNICLAVQIETTNVPDAILKDTNPIQKA